MIDTLKPYPAMKDSGVPWLGEVPEHWEVRKLRQVLTRRTERNRPDLPLLSVVRERGVILRDTTSGDENHNYIPDDLSNYKVVRSGQFAMNKMKAWQGSYGVSQYDGIVSPAYFVFDLGGISGAFFNASIRSRAYVPAFTQASDGVRIGQWDLSETRMREISFALPPLPEQRAITRFLTHADRRIRRYIRAKQKLIKLLEEQKQAIIHRAVTRGLDPNVRLKPSGVEWLEDVPEHWEVVALKRVLKQLVDCEHKTAPAVDQSDYRVVRTTAVRNGHLRWSGTYCTSAEAFQNWTQRAVPEPGDVIFTREAPAGEACLVPKDAKVCLGQRTVLMKLRRDEYDAQFLVHMIYAGPPRLRVQLASQGSTVGHFNMDDIGWMKVLVPPLPEQRSIVAAIARDTVSLNKAAERAEREIDLLREYRTRLIADVVTGKIDVREAALLLPDEAEEPEPLDEIEAEAEPDETGADDTDAVPEEAEE
jgi:type I restriction enzyme S subunit